MLEVIMKDPVVHPPLAAPLRISPSWQRLNRILWVIFMLFALAYFALEISFSYRALLQPSEPLLSNLAGLGISLKTYAVYLLSLRSLYMLVHLVIAGLIMSRRSEERIAFVVACILVLMGTALWPYLRQASALPESWRLLGSLAGFLSTSSFIVFFYIFPDGRFTPRWTKYFMLLILVLEIGLFFLPDTALNPRNWGALPATILSLSILGSELYAPVYRYRHVSNSVLRQQTKWVVYGIAATILGSFLLALPGTLHLLEAEPGSAYGLVAGTGIVLVYLFLPLSIGVAVLRFRLWDIDPIINRTLVYGALSLCTLGFYILSVGYLASYFRSNEASLIISILATGIVAILFEPLRERLQRGVNRLMYGERDDPATVLTRLSQRLDSAIVPGATLQTIVETLAQTLRLPHAAIALLSQDGEPRIASAFGSAPPGVICLPLTYQSERVGELILAPRAPGESFSSADMNLISIIAQQAGVAAYTVRLNDDLQQSRQRLVTAQEEERRRLRRDLHDGVGPTLASLSQRLDTAADLVRRDPEESVRLLKELKGQVKGTVAEIRRLVYALRPPVLDEFGLVSAIREHVAPYTGPNGLRVTFDVTEPLPPLPAAVEVAAYRIILEAFTNVVRHAEAGLCAIRIRLDDGSLLFEVADNGKGVSSKPNSGVGLASMRERARELGGECVIERIPTGGTRVRARLSVAKE